jgi:hypothetical protein
MDVEEDARQVPLTRSAAGEDRKQTFESVIRSHSKVMTQVTLDSRSPGSSLSFLQIPRLYLREVLKM